MKPENSPCLLDTESNTIEATELARPTRLIEVIMLLPAPNESDPEDVTTALETAAIFAAKGDVSEASRWLGRAADFANLAGNAARAETLALSARALAATRSDSDSSGETESEVDCATLAGTASETRLVETPGTVRAPAGSRCQQFAADAARAPARGDSRCACRAFGESRAAVGSRVRRRRHSPRDRRFLRHRLRNRAHVLKARRPSLRSFSALRHRARSTRSPRRSNKKSPRCASRRPALRHRRRRPRPRSRHRSRPSTTSSTAPSVFRVLA